RAGERGQRRQGHRQGTGRQGRRNATDNNGETVLRRRGCAARDRAGEKDAGAEDPGGRAGARCADESVAEVRSSGRAHSKPLSFVDVIADGCQHRQITTATSSLRRVALPSERPRPESSFNLLKSPAWL